MKNRMRMGLGALAVLLAVLTGCGVNPQTGEPAVGTDLEAPEQKAIIAVGGEAATLDPHKSFSGNVFVVTNQIYESLIARSPDGSLAPRLATEWKALNETTWELRLRKGVLFHDGSPFNAEAVKFSLERLKDPATKGPGAYIITMVQTVKVVDEHTVHLITDKPFAPLPAHLAHPVAAMVSPSAAGKDLGRQPVGTGPFRFKDWQAGEAVVLSANADYWGGKPKLETVTFRVIPETGTQLVELKAGTIDLFSAVQPEKYDELVNDKQLTATKFLGWGSFYLGFNTKQGPLAKVEVRQAIARAIDRKLLVSTLRKGMAEEASAPIPKTVFGAATSLRPIPYDLIEARALLQKAGVTTPLRIKLNTYDNTETRQIAGAIQAQLREIGIEVEIQVTDSGAYAKETLKPDHDLYLTGWGTVTMDADYALWAWYHSGQHQADNRAFYASPEVDQWLQEARGSSDPTLRAALYTKIQERVQEDLPYLTLYYPLTSYAKNRRLQGEVFPFALINLDLRKAEIR